METHALVLGAPGTLDGLSAEINKFAPHTIHQAEHAALAHYSPEGFAKVVADATKALGADAIDGLLSGSVRHRQFLGFVQRARAEVVKVLGLTPSELASKTMIEMRDALDGTLGVKFGLPTRETA